MDIPHRKKDEPSKLVTELRLYRLLYENWNGRADYQDEAGEGEENEDPGVPLADLQRLADLSQRTWNRYLRELEACHAVKSARFHLGGRYCLAEEGYLDLDYDEIEDAHLQRLYRTVQLLRQWLDGEQRGPEELDTRFYSKVFFTTRLERDMWFEDYMVFYDRTMQRDMKDVWTALRDY
jgi:hypothetical protein